MTAAREQIIEAMAREMEPRSYFKMDVKIMFAYGASITAEKVVNRARKKAAAALAAIGRLAAVVPRDQYDNEPYCDDLDDLTREANP